MGDGGKEASRRRVDVGGGPARGGSRGRRGEGMIEEECERSSTASPGPPRELTTATTVVLGGRRGARTERRIVAKEAGKEERLLGGEEGLDLAVHDEDEGGADGAEGVGAGALEEGAEALVGDDLAEAVHGVLVDPLGLGLLGLHLEASPDGVEGVGGVGGGEGGGLGAAELGGDADEALVLLVGVDADEGVVDAKVGPAEGDDADDGDAKAVVEAEEAGGAGRRLDEAVHEAVELLLALADVGREASAGVVERVDDAERARAGEAARGHVDQEKLPKVRLRAVLGEHGLDRVLERKVERLGREVPQDVDQVPAPERPDPLLRRDPRERVQDARVWRHLAGDNLRVGGLRLDDELHALDRGGARLGDRARDAAREEVNHEVRPGVLTHFF
mmetsp:Transcript_11530/g.36642  ORF Transcript_11530/g.36642 Transcript_11530/m.36642 type:complete len:390 (-) Transcript_11530:108-1277(-)